MAKSAEAFRTISEASKELGVPQHVLRHWEDVFGHIRPMRRAGGRRYYRPVDIDLLRGVRVLLYDERYTTKGVQKIFRENGAKYITEIGRRTEAGESVDVRGDLEGKEEPSSPSAEISAATESAVVGTINSSDEVNIPPDALARLRNLVSRLERVQDALDNTILAIDAIAVDGMADEERD